MELIVRAQLDFARTRPGARTAKFQLGDAMALPFSDDSFDVAVMALAIYFVPDPAKGVAEMARVVRPRGQIAAFRMGRRRRQKPLRPLFSRRWSRWATRHHDSPALMPRGLKHFTNCG